MAVWMVLIQVCWVGLALAHRLRDPRDGSIPMLEVTRPGPSLLLPLPRFLFFLSLPGLRPAGPAWLLPREVGVAPELREGLSALATQGRGLAGGTRFGLLCLALGVLVLGAAPPLVMGLAFRGALVGDPTAVPDALAALGAYTVSMVALGSARLHTRTSVVWLSLVPVSACLLSLAWLLGAVSAQNEPEAGG